MSTLRGGSIDSHFLTHRIRVYAGTVIHCHTSEWNTNAATRIGKSRDLQWRKGFILGKWQT